MRRHLFPISPGGSHLRRLEKHLDGYVAYPLGLTRGAVLSQDDSYEAALADVRSALAFHVETFGAESLAPAESSAPTSRLDP